MRHLFILSIFLPVLLFSCTKNIADFNNDPKKALTVPATSLFLNGQKNLADTYVSPGGGTAPFRFFAQSWTQNTYTTEARYILSAYNAPDNWWTDLYGGTAPTTTLPAATNGVINNLAQAKGLFYLSALNPAMLKNELIITDLMEIYSYNLLVTTYGDIPYTEAESSLIPFPKYDDAKTVYADLLMRLDTCIAGLDVSAQAMGSADQIYKGSPAAWKKFAATLKLKMAMLLADKDPATATKKVQEAIVAGVFTSNADNAILTYMASPTSNTNPIWQANINSGRHDNCPTNIMINTLQGWNDPRLPLYFTKDVGGSGQYLGGIPGAGNAYVALSTFSDQWNGPTWPADLLDYPECQFLLAEAAERGMNPGLTAEQYYDNAITASIQYWGGSASDAAAYLLQPAVAYSSATGNYKQKIGYQKWIALADRGWDAWTEIRRLGYPDLNTVNPPVGAEGQIPIRFYYPTTEQSSNPINWAAAVKAVSGGTADVVTTKLFWML
jgi:hypothetical protein